MILLVISQIAGCFFAVSCFFLIWKEKIYIDKETKEVISVNLPLGIKMRTHVPVIVLFIFSVTLILVPLWHNDSLVAIKGRVTTNKPLKVYAVAAEIDTRGEVLLQVPRNARYRVIFIPSNSLSDQIQYQTVDLYRKSQEEYQLPPLNIGIISEQGDEWPRQAPIHTENSSIVGNFKNDLK